MEDEIREILIAPHHGFPWQRNYQTGMLESTCECGDVISIKEKYEYPVNNPGYQPYLKHAGSARADHHVDKMVSQIMAVFDERKIDE